MNRTVKKINVIIIVILTVSTLFFFYKAGYINPFPPEQTPSPDPNNTTSPPEQGPTPPASFIPANRRDVSGEDEGVHYDKLRISREWWYYSAVLNGEHTELKNWVVQISFNHMARSDLLGTGKPDLLLVTLSNPNGDLYGGIINKERGFGILKDGALTAGSPGVKVKFENSWAEGSYPQWHVHAEGFDVEASQDLVIDLNYHANSLPIWTFGTRVFDESDSSLANYIFLGCSVNGTITVNGETYKVSGTGHHEHSWAPNLLTRESINGWDWFHFSLGNGYSIYANSFYPTPQALSTDTSRINPFSTILLTSDNGATFTELKNVDLKITSEDVRVFPFVKMPSGFTITGRPSLDPLHAISQSLLIGTKIHVTMDISTTAPYNKVWKFPTYVGMKTSLCSLTGTLSWSDDEGDYEIALDGYGASWSMRALL